MRVFCLCLYEQQIDVQSSISECTSYKISSNLLGLLERKGEVSYASMIICDLNTTVFSAESHRHVSRCRRSTCLTSVLQQMEDRL